MTARAKRLCRRGRFVSCCMPPESRSRAIYAMVLLCALGCSADDRVAPDPSTLVIAKPAEASGDEQIGIAGRPLAESLRVVVTRDGAPVPGVTVLWATNEGSVSPTSVETDAAGTAATSWTTQDLFAQQFASAQVDGGGTVIGFLARTTPDPAANNTILVLSEGGSRFDPAQYTVPVGGTVNWFWPEGSTGHNIVPDDGDSPPQSGPPTDYPKFHVFRFTKPGVFRYHCSIHGGPGGVGMSGVVTVVPPVNE